MAISSLITAGASYSSVQPGIKSRVLLGNFEEIASYTEASGIITAITMDSLKTFFAYAGFRRSANARSEMVRNDFGVFYKHQVLLKVFDRQDTIKQQIMKANVTKLVAIVENFDRNNDMTFEVYGIDAGLTVQSCVMDYQDGGAVWDMDLSSDDPDGLEQYAPKTFFNTNYATTLTAVDALLT